MSILLCLSMEYKLEHHCKCDDFSYTFLSERGAHADLKQLCAVSATTGHTARVQVICSI